MDLKGIREKEVKKIIYTEGIMGKKKDGGRLR
jgi:hypothetical protein